MSKTRMGKRVASLLLSLVMMLSLLPTTVYATEDTGGGTGATYDAVQQTESGDNTENTGKLESTGEGEDDSEAGNNTEGTGELKPTGEDKDGSEDEQPDGADNMTSSAAAEVNGTGYETLAAAINAANTGDTVTLLADVNLDSAQTISKQLTIDLNGKTINSTAYRTIRLKTGADLTVKDSAGGGKIANTYKGSANPATIYLEVAGTKFTLESGAIESDPNETSLQSVAINSEKYKACEVNINGGSVTVPEAATEGRAIVASTNSMTLNIRGGTIAGGLHGVDAYSGSTVNITGGEITARVVDTGVIKEAYGMRLIGTANVTVAGGTITGVKMDDNGYKLDVPTVKLESGTINGSFYSISPGTIIFNVAENATIVLANDSAAKFLPNEVKLVQNSNGTYGVKAGTYVAEVAEVGGKKYESLDAAFAAVQDNETVKLLDDINLQKMQTVSDKTFTLDLNGHNIINEELTALMLAGSTNMTVQDTSEKASGMLYGGYIGIFVTEKATLTVKSGTVKGGTNAVTNSGTVNIEGTANLQRAAGEGVHCESGSITNMTGGTVFDIGPILTMNAKSDVTVKISGGVVENYAYATEVTGGKIKDLTLITGCDISGAEITDSIQWLNGNVPTLTDDVTLGENATVRNEGYCFNSKKTAIVSSVAKIGSTEYATLKEAINAANTSNTITLLDDVDLGTSSQYLYSTLTAKKNVHNLTFDLNGHTITSSSPSQTVTASREGLVIKNGTIENTAASTKHGAIYATFSTKGTHSLTLENVTVIAKDKGIYTTMANGNATVTIGDKTVINAKTGIDVVGPMSDSQTCAGSLTLNVSGGTVTGTECGIHVKGPDKKHATAAVTVNVTGGEVSSITTDSKPSDLQTKVDISGGTVTGDLKNSGKDVITISGGTFKGTVKNLGDGSITISGGTFTTKPNETYLAEGYTITQNGDGTYGIKKTTYVAEYNGTQYTSLQEAIKAAGRNATVKLLADTRENVTISTPYLTLDLNGFTLNGSTGERKPALTVTARVTVKDSSENQTGTIMREDTAENSGVSSHYVIDVQGDGWLTFESGNVKNNSGIVGVTGASLVRVGDDSVAKYPGLNIKGGTFTQDNFIVIKVDRGDLFLNGGTLNSAHSYAIEDWHRATIKGGAVNGTVAAWTYSGGLNSDLTISGGTINGDVTSVNYGNAEDKVAKVSITGGTITGELDTRSYDPKTGELTSIDDAAKATIKVTGGTFDKDPTKYVVEDSAVNQNADGTFGVAKAYLAKVGKTSYYTMDEARKAQSTSGEDIVLLRDYTTGSPFRSGISARVVDLNGYTWTCTGKDANSAAFEISNHDAMLTVKNGKVVSSQLVGLIPSAMGGTITYDNSSLVFDGVEMSTTAHSGIETNGNNTNDTVTLKNSTLNVPNGFGIYFPSSGTLTIDKSTINAKTMGVQVCSGSLNINAGSGITVTGDEVPKTENDGAIQDGAAISIVNRTGYKGLDKIEVTGGKFTAKTGNDAIKAYNWADKTEKPFTAKETVAVSGGTFTSAIPEDYCAEGFIPTANSDGTHGVKAGKYVAYVGTSANKFETLQEAINAAANGATVTLLADCESDRINLEDKSITVDLNGKTLTSTAAYGVMFCAKNGNTITVNGTTEGSRLVGTLMVTAETDGHIVINGGIYESAKYCPIYINGAVSSDSSTLTVKDATITALSGDSNQDNGVAVYLAGYSTSTFTNTTITAPVTGLEIRAGKLTLTDCTVTGGSGEVVTNANGNGTTVTNAAVAISQHTTKKDIDVSITGGTYTAKAAVYQTNVQGTGSENVKVSIESGTFNGTVSAETNNTVAISGGMFSSAVPENCCATGYIPTANADGTYGVKEGKYVAYVGTLTSKFETLQAAIDAAKDGQIVRLLADITLTETAVFPAGKKVSINLQGHNITATGTALRINGKTDIQSTGGNGTIKSTGNVAVAVGENANLTVYSGTLEGREGAVITGTSTGATIDIRKNATLIATDNAVIAGNGSKRDGNPNTILVKGGTFIGGIESTGYIACGIYAPWNDNVTVSGGTFNITNGAGIVARAGTVKVTGGTFNCTGDGTGWVGDNKNQIPCAALVFDKAANYPALTADSQILVSGGSFSTDPAANGATLADGYVATQTDGMYKVAKSNPVAEINGVKYDTLSKAIAALEGTGGTIKLLQDINAPSMNYKITENITIDLNGHDITGSGAEGVFYVYTSGHLTITGDGVITAVENNKAAIAVQVFSEKAKVTLEGGTYKQKITNRDDPHFDLIYVYYGTAEIKGGTYEGATPDWTLNCKDENYKAGTAHITVTGGTFVGFDPANNTAEGEGTSFVPDGYIPKANGDGSYTVVKGTYVAEYDGTKYETLQKAIDAASQKNGGQAVVTLLGDLTITETVNFANVKASSVLLDLGGCTLTGENCRALQINKGNLYLENGTVTSTGIADSKSVIRIGSDDTTYSGSNPMLYMRNGAKVLAPVSYGVTIFGSATVSETLTVAGNASIEATGPSPAISGQGGQAYHVDGKGTKVIITGNAVVSATNNYAIYHPDNGTLDIQGGTITGKGGIQMCSGTLNISGSPKIEALGKANHETGASGPIYDIAAISVVNRGYPGGAPVVTIKGTPTITANEGEVIHAYTWSSNAESVWAEAGENINVSGGTYSKTFNTAYLAADCTLVANNDTTYTVKQKPVAEYNGTPYTSLPQALQDARNAGGGEVKLLKDVTQTTSSLDIGKVTLDLNRQTLTLDGGAQLYTSNAATIKNGTIKRTDEPTSGNANDFAIQVMSGSSLTLGATSADTVTIESTYGVYNAGGTLTVSHAVITTDGWSIAVNDSKTKTGEVTIGEGAVITSKTGNCIGTRVNSKPNVTITGGQLTSDGTNWDAGVIYWASEGTLTITGGTFTASSAEGSTAAAVYQKNGTVKISGNTAKLLGNNALVVQAGDGSTGTMVTELSGGTYSTKPEKAWVVDGYRAIENTDGSYTVEEGKFTVQVTSRTVSSDTPVANVSGGGETTYEVGTTVTAASLSGYTFKGWYLEKYTDDNSTLVKTDLSFTYKPTADCTLIAVYEPISGAKFYLTVNASEFTVGESAVYDSYMHDQVAAGESVTVTFAGKENFLYWVNASRKVVSISKEYTFIMGSETTLTAVYGKTREAQATVVFMSDSDQIITSKAYKSGTAIQFPTPPIKMGCTFTGWSMTEQKIQAAIAASNNGVIVVKACYTDPSTPYTVTVLYPDDTKEEYSGMVGKTVTLTAKEISGKIFSYWTDSENNVLGYAKTLMLAPSGSITVKAVYSDTAVEAKPVITMTAVEAGEVGTGYYVISFTATRAVPEGYTVVKQGILYSVDSQCSGEGAKDYMKLTDEGSVPAGIYVYEGNNTALSGVTRFNAKTGAVDRTIYGRGYMVLKNSSGAMEYVYSDNILSGNYSGLANIGG